MFTLTQTLALYYFLVIKYTYLILNGNKDKYLMRDESWVKIKSLSLLIQQGGTNLPIGYGMSVA